MEEKSLDSIIKSGNGNKSIGSYVDQICKELMENLNITIKAYNNNMNKLITIVEIIKRALNQNNEKEYNYSNINYEIGKDKNIPFIKCNIKINKEEVNKLKNLIGNKNNKRNLNPFTKNKNENKMKIEYYNNKNKYKIDNNIKKEDKINDLCIQNIHEFFK